MMTTIHEVYETVRDARADGPDALAAMALSYGATIMLGTVRCRALRGQIAELRAAATAADEMVATLRHERDAAQAELKAERESATREEVWRLRTALDECRTARDVAMRERDEARSIAAMRDRALTAAVQEREAFSLRLSAAERERDEAQAERDALRSRPTYDEWRGHFRAGGSWLVLRPQWVPLVTILRGAYLSGAYLSGADLRGAARYTDDAIIPGWTLRDGRLVREVSP